MLFWLLSGIKKCMEDPKEKWYFKTHVLIITFLFVGPLCLPIVLFNPNYDKKKKTVISIIIIILSILMGTVFVNSMKSIIKYYSLVF